jgi:uncharacterized damage-inducible protein DinB
MNALTLLRALAANDAWSNLRLHRAAGQLGKDEYEAPRTSFFPSLPATLNHILIVDDYYLDALEEGGKGLKAFASEMPWSTLETLAKEQRRIDLRLVAFVDAIADEATLDKAIRLEREGRIQVERMGDLLMHLFTHQIHHRGQVHAMLAGTKVKPPQLDEYFMGDDLPLRKGELAELGLPLALG